MLSAYLVFNSDNDMNRTVKAGALFSSFYALTLGINSVMVRLLDYIGERIVQSLGGSVPETWKMSSLMNSFVAFVIAFILFNIPYLYYYLKSDEKSSKVLLYNIIPVALFLIIYFSGGFISSMIIDGWG